MMSPQTIRPQKHASRMFITALAYGLPFIGIALLLIPVTQILSGMYAKYYGLTLTTIATVMLVANIFDAVTDPIIGYYSDRWRVRTGSRKPFIVVGSVLLVPCSYFLFVPPAEVSAAYFTFWYIMFYLALTLFIIPYMAWANEFTTGSKDKMLVFSVTAFANRSGGVLFYLIPLLPLFSTTKITPQILLVSVVSGVGLLLLGVILILNLVPDRPRVAPALIIDDTVNRMSTQQKMSGIIHALFGNKPFVLFIMAFMCLGFSIGMWVGIFFIYVDIYLKLGDVFAKVSLWGMAAGALAIPVWYRLSLLMGKRPAWLLGMALLAGLFLCTSLLNTGGAGLLQLFALKMMMTFAGSSMATIATPILCDTIDYGRLKDKVERNALYFSFNSLMTKIPAALGGSLGLMTLTWFGFDVHAAEQSELSVVGLHFAVSWVPTFFVVLAMAFIAVMPLNERRMTIIRKRLAKFDGLVNRDAWELEKKG